ncbi:FtsX-like permease family protein [Nocardioides perillae]|uniref:ABC3 transporter permease C-terminal domain-containing protein n=1 Tax=Nocardioides perillae TaxID=1119534 RepID=A0A7Y9RT58_9ACTN|nr:FtsX-like permease family protein [Nocardioides perillae]NYG54092.1 hypothetical protein [Nocardioides perillae]
MSGRTGSTGLATVLRGVRARALLSAGSVLLTLLAVGSAVLGPVFSVAVTSSYLVTRLDDAPATLTGLTWVFEPGADPAGAEASARGAVAALDPGPFSPLRVQRESTRLPGLGGEVQLLAKEGACARLAVTGRCPSGADEVLLLEGDLERSGVDLGSIVAVDAGGRSLLLEVVGSYRAPAADDYWFDALRFVSTPAQGEDSGSGEQPYRPAPLVVDAVVFDRLPAGTWSLRLDAPLAVDPTWTTADLAPAVAAAERLAEVEADAPGGRLTGVSLNDLRAVAAEVEAEQATARSSVAPAVLSLVLVALALLLRLLLAAGELRVPELALASLRGLTGRRLWALGLAEPLVVLLAAVPLGVAGGYALAWVLARAWLVPGLPVRLPGLSLVAAALVVLAAVGVAVVAVGLVLRTGLAAQLAGARRPTGRTRTGLVLELLVWAAALAVLATELGGAQGDRPDATDLVLPVLLAVVAGLAAVRLTGRVAGWWTRHRARSRSLAGFVAARALSRRREGTLVVLPLTAAVAVGVFSVGVHDAAAGWRGSVAATAAPAASVWRSDLPLAATVELTHDLDPDGRWLMAASSGALGRQRLSVVDTTRLARVGAWPDTWTPGRDAADVAGLIGPQGEVPRLVGREVGLTVEPRPSRGAAEPLVVELRLRTPDGEPARTYLGPYPAGRATTRTTDLGGCEAGCRLEGLTVGRAAGLQVRLSGSVVLRDLTVDGEPVPGALDEAGWAPTPEYAAAGALTDLTAADGELTLAVDSGDDEAVVRLTSGGVPLAAPVLVGADAVSGLETDEEGRTVLRLSSGDLVVEPRGTAASTPFTGPAGVLVDATVLANDRPFYDEAFTTTVLVAADAPAAVRESLAGQGLVETATLAGTRAALDRSAYALALRLYLVVAALVLLMATAGLVVSTAVQLPARRRDAAALRVVGVRRATVVSAVVRETGVVLGSAALAGLGAGTLAQWVVTRTVTLGFGEDLSTPALVADVDGGRLLASAALALAALGAVAVVSALLTVRGARGASLREDAR